MLHIRVLIGSGVTGDSVRPVTSYVVINNPWTMRDMDLTA